MKTYGPNKATEFSRKQISVIYGKARRSELKVERWVMAEMYDLADYYGYDDNGSVAQAEDKILRILEAVFNNDDARAQDLIDAYTASEWSLKGKKAQDKANRALVG